MCRIWAANGGATKKRATMETTFRIKQSVFNLSEFLRNDELTEKFAKGSMIISRLCLTDYHHFHFADSGIPGEAISIRGKCYAGGPS